MFRFFLFHLLMNSIVYSLLIFASGQITDCLDGDGEVII